MLTFIFNSNTATAINHLAAIKQSLAGAQKVLICSGHLKRGGIDAISTELRKAVDRGARIIFYSNGQDTDARAVVALKKLGIEHIVVDGFYLHTKLYFFETADSFSAYVGSANITKNGLTSNEEFSVQITGATGDDQHQAISEYAAYLDGRCRAGRATSTAVKRRRTVERSNGKSFKTT